MKSQMTAFWLPYLFLEGVECPAILRSFALFEEFYMNGYYIVKRGLTSGDKMIILRLHRLPAMKGSDFSFWESTLVWRKHRLPQSAILCNRTGVFSCLSRKSYTSIRNRLDIRV